MASKPSSSKRAHEVSIGYVEHGPSMAPPDDLQDHRDAANRYSNVGDAEKHKDHYIDPEDGRLALLRVQHLQGYEVPHNVITPWERPLTPTRVQNLWAKLKNASTEILVWTYEDFLDRSASSREIRRKRSGLRRAIQTVWTNRIFRYPVGAILLIPTMPFSTLEGKLHCNGQYPAVRYRDVRYPLMARNELENNPNVAPETYTSTAEIREPYVHPKHTISTWTVPMKTLPPRRQILKDARQEEFDGAFGRHARPRYLCVLPRPNDPPGPQEGYMVVDVDQWDRTQEEPLDYVGISYTREHFQTNTKKILDKRITRNPTPTKQQWRDYNGKLNLLSEDLRELYAIGVASASAAHVRGFWIDVLCMDEAHVERDAHRICDVVRGAKALVIAIKEPVVDRLTRGQTGNPASRGPDDDRVMRWLRTWGSRMWTLPELLLAPNKEDLRIYMSINGIPIECRPLSPLPKRSVAPIVYTKDGHLIRQLLDHFDGSIILTQTELLTIGLQALINRKANTDPYAEADVIYALMTLSRRRPKKVKGQSMFVAFAQLSLLNNVDRLLERLICLLPSRRGLPWYVIEDHWGARLWDIDPRDVQVAAIAGEQTVVLDGAFGAAIVWDKLPRVGFLKRPMLWRTVLEYAIRFTPGWLVLGIQLLVAFSKSTPKVTSDGHGKFSVSNSLNPLIALGILFMLIAVTIVAVLPAALLSVYRGKFWSTQALFIGMEGAVTDLDDLEKKLFGFSDGRLQWSTFASTQSVHNVRTKPTRLRGEGIELEVEGFPPSHSNLKYEPGVVINVYGGGNRKIGFRKAPADPACANAAVDGVTVYGTAVVEPDRLFTLVDTYTLTVTTFRAVHPPSAVLVCGQEGGAQRALLCSYDFAKQTFHRETVLRMPSSVLNRLDRVERFRFSMESMPLSNNG